jgi:hypothetical protein
VSFITADLENESRVANMSTDAQSMVSGSNSYRRAALNPVQEARFNRLVSLQNRGPLVVRMIAQVAWRAIDESERLELIQESVGVYATANPSDQATLMDAFINMRLITKYLDSESDTHHTFHEDIISRPVETSAFGDDASDLPPAA